MTTFTLQKLSDEAIVICTLQPDWQASADCAGWASAILDMLNRLKHPAYLIFDLQGLHMDMQDITLLANEAARGCYSFTSHTMLRGFLLVSKESLIELTAKGMKTETFGFAPTSAYTCLEDALESARGLLSAAY